VIQKNIFSWRGTIDARSYLIWGIVLSILKFNIDRFVARKFFSRPWTIQSYLQAEIDSIYQLATNTDEATFYGSMLLIALPFTWIGVCLTVRRLRDIGLPLYLILMFFVPVINILFFVLLATAPTHEERDSPRANLGKLSRYVPKNTWGAALISALVPSCFGVLCAMLSLNQFENYGFGLFLAIPFASGFLAAVLVNTHEQRGFLYTLGASILPIVLIGVALIFLAAEGAICLLMAFPIAAILSILGGIVGFIVSRVGAKQDASVLALVLVTPLLMGAEPQLGFETPIWSVSTEKQIDAPPEVVWQHVVSFSELPPPQSPLLQTGVAYPVRARIQGQGVGAVRYCEFSTGAFVEPITVWDQPNRLAFDVVSQPRPMDEWSPYAHIEAPHLDGTLQSVRGEFLLKRRADGGTLVVGTTWYKNKMWPAQYWRTWSDLLIHAIHNEVLSHVETLSCGPAASDADGQTQ
jgi:uncharacterized membrane protein YhaH (DUF805 family)